METFTFFSEEIKTNFTLDGFFLLYTPIRLKYKHIYIGNNPTGDYDLVISKHENKMIQSKVEVCDFDDPEILKRNLRIILKRSLKRSLKDSECVTKVLQEIPYCENLQENKSKGNLKAKISELKSEDTPVENIFRKLQAIKPNKSL